MSVEIRLTVAIVDDEPPVRDLVRACVDWDALGMTVSQEAPDAETATRMFAQSVPDILLTDICMPYSDGLTLAEQVKRDHPDTEVLILTGYDEFDYAKRSIDIGVAKFLMKPIDDEELTATLQTVGQGIRCHKEMVHEYQSLKQLLTEKRALTITSGKEQTSSVATSGAHSSPRAAQLVARVKSYVDANLDDENLTLTSVADHFNVSAGHLSRLFSKQARETFVAYVTRRRIETATELLHSSYLLGYEIAERVGIPDAHYFSVCFRKLTGVSVTQYRRSLAK